MVWLVSDGSVRWPTTALVALGIIAPLNIKITAEPWTDLQFRILILVALVVSLGLVVRSLAEGDGVRPGWRWPDRVEWLAFTWLAAVWLSALLSEARALGSAGAARLSVAILLIPATRSVVRTREDAARILRAIAVGTMIGAAIGLAVWVWGSEVGATRIFVGEATRLGPMNRLTRPWAHANIAAVVFAVTVATIATLQRRAMVWAGLSLVAVALVLTVSRGGLLAGLGVGLAWIAVRRRRVDVVAVLALATIAAVTILVSSAWGTRIEQLGDEAFYANTVQPPAGVVIDSAGAVIEVEVTNNSATLWPQAGDRRVLISARWLGSDGLIWIEDRWPLPRDLAPGESLTAMVDIEARVPAGDYSIRWDLVIPRTAYFGQFLGDEPVLSEGNVTSSDIATDDVDPYGLTPRTVGLRRTEIWRLAWAEFKNRPLLGVGPNEFGSAAVSMGLQPEGRTPASHAHSIVLEPLATWGIAGAVPFFVLVVGAFVRVSKASWRSRELVPSVLTVAMVGVFLHGLVEWPLVVITTGIPIGLILGLAWSDAVIPDGTGEE